MGGDSLKDMSGVYKSEQSPTGIEFEDTAREIHKELIRLLMNEKLVPKKYRYVYTIPIMNIYHSMRRNITQANSIYANKEYLLEMRLKYQQMAIGDCESIIQEMQDMVYTLDSFPASKTKVLIGMLINEAKLLRGWKQSSKLLYQ